MNTAGVTGLGTSGTRESCSTLLARAGGDPNYELHVTIAADLTTLYRTFESLDLSPLGPSVDRRSAMTVRLDFLESSLSTVERAAGEPSERP